MTFRFNPHDYGPVAARLLADERIPPLGPGTENDSCCQRVGLEEWRLLFDHSYRYAAG